MGELPRVSKISKTRSDEIGIIAAILARRSLHAIEISLTTARYDFVSFNNLLSQLDRI
jgi:hypothetical protein